jgi:DNA-binding Lrp family transcriptional regulator
MLIDEIDIKILNIIQSNARTSNAEIARQIGMTTSGVFERIKRLEQRGIIKGFKAIIDPKALGLDILAFIYVRVRPAANSQLAGRQIAELGGVQEVFYLAGEDTFMCKVRCSSTRDLTVLLESINDVDRVVGTRVTLALRSLKEYSNLPARPVDTLVDPFTDAGEANMESKNRVFDKTLSDYLTQISDLDVPGICQPLGVFSNSHGVTIPFFGENYRVSSEGVWGPSGERPHVSVSVILCKYLLYWKQNDRSSREWASFKDFKDSAPMAGAFRYNTERLIAKTFSSRLLDLEKACEALGCQSVDEPFPYQLMKRMQALPRVPVLLLFNDEDEEFPARCTVLFQKDADLYLDMECLAMVGMYMAHRLRKG